MIKKIANYPYEEQNNSQQYHQTPEEQYYSQFTPEQIGQLQEYYRQQQMQQQQQQQMQQQPQYDQIAYTEPEEVKKNSLIKDNLLGAAIGAATGAGGLAATSYWNNRERNRDRARDAMHSFKKHEIDPLYTKIKPEGIKGKLKNKLSPSMIQETKSNINNLAKKLEGFKNRTLNPELLHNKGLKGIRNIKPGSALAAVLSGGLAGLLINKYNKDQE